MTHLKRKHNLAKKFLVRFYVVYFRFDLLKTTHTSCAEFEFWVLIGYFIQY